MLGQHTRGQYRMVDVPGNECHLAIKGGKITPQNQREGKGVVCLCSLFKTRLYNRDSSSNIKDNDICPSLFSCVCPVCILISYNETVWLLGLLWEYFLFNAIVQQINDSMNALILRSWD